MFLKLALKQFFDFDEFRPGQEEVIKSVLAQKDTLGVLPTGTGKSLCYQLAGYLVEGLVLVVSPLIALMEDQVSALQAAGEKRCIALTSQVEQGDRYAILRRLKQYKFLFLSPEMLQNAQVLAALNTVKLAFLVVDEAHCVSQWGIDFRPEYRLLPGVKEQLGNPVVLALTATATPAVMEDIQKLLLNDTGQVFRHSADRPNIAYFVEQPADKIAWVKNYLSQTKGSGLIYCATRQGVEELYQALSGTFSCGYYHGGLASDQRRLAWESINPIYALCYTMICQIVRKTTYKKVGEPVAMASLLKRFYSIKQVTNESRSSSNKKCGKNGRGCWHYFPVKCLKERPYKKNGKR